MKKYYSLLFIILFSLFVIPNVYAADNVSIESVTFDSKSETTEIVNEATFEGLAVKFDVKFTNLKDFVKYKVVINNKSNQDYEISENNNFGDNKFIVYEYSFDDNNRIAEKNKKTTMFITIKYNDLVPNELLVDGKYKEEKTLTISLGDRENILNPNTASSIFIVLFLAFITVIISIALFKTNKTTLSILVIILLLVPVTVFAIEKIEIKVDSKIEIEVPRFCIEYVDKNKTEYYPYELGMTVKDYFDSSYNNNLFIKIEEFEGDFYILPSDYNYTINNYCNGIDDLNGNPLGYVDQDIMNSKEGCYRFKYQTKCK